MSSRSVGIIAPDQAQAGATEALAWVDGTTHALLVKVVNPGGGGGGGTEFFEDTPHVSGDAGNMPLAVRKDAAGTLVSTDGDYAPLQVDASGALRVVVVGGGGGGGGTQFAEDAPHASGDQGTLALVVRNDTPGALAGTDLDYAPLQVDATGRLRVAVDASVALSVAVSNFPATQAVTQSTSPWVIGDGGGSITVDGTIAATQSGAWTVSATQGTSPWVVGDGGGSLTVDGTIAATQSGAWTVSVSGTVGVTQSTSPWVVSGTVAVSNVTPGTGVTDLGKAVGGSFAFAGDVGVAMLCLDSGTLTWQPLLSTGNSVHTNVNGLTPGTASVNLGKAEDAPHTTGDVGLMPLAVRNDAMSVMAANGDYHPFMVNNAGRLVVTLPDAIAVGSVGIVGQVVPGTGPTDLGKESLQPFSGGDVGVMFLGVRESDGVYLPFIQQDQGYMCVEIATVRTGATGIGKTEDSGHNSGDLGIAVWAVRQDSLANSTSTDGDYAPFKVDNLGALYVNMGNPTSLADGQIANSQGVIFAATARTKVESLDIFNTSSTLTETVKVYFQQSGGTARQVRQYTLGPLESASVLDGDLWNMENGDEIEAVTTTASTVNYVVTGIVR